MILYNDGVNLFQILMLDNNGLNKYKFYKPTNMKSSKRIFCLKGISFLMLFFVIFSCNKDKEIESSAYDISGTWIINEKIMGNCQGATYPDYVTDVYVITQNGNSVSIVRASTGQNLTGTMTGSKLTWSGVLTEGRGTNNINFTGDVLNNGDSIAGNVTWTYTKGTYNCSGTATVTAYKLGDNSTNVTGIWRGTWESDENSYDGVFTANITQNNSVLTGTIDVPYIGLDGAELTGTVNGSAFTFGDIDGEIVFTGIIGTDTLKASGNYKYDAMNDEGTWQAIKTVKVEPIDWMVTELALILTNQQNLIICDVHNDGIKRIYTSDDNQGNGNIHELTYNSGVWEDLKFEYGGEESIMINALGYGVGQTDTQNRLYACGNGLFEHTIDNAGWEMDILDTDYAWFYDIAVGSGRNDGTNRVYAGSGDGIYEFTYVSGNWSYNKIDTENKTIGQLLITNGRNDGVLRLYAASGNNLLEYTFTAGEWSLTNLINADAVDIEEMVVGNGRNDGKNRIYIAANGGVAELDYSEGAWNIIPISEVSYSSHIAVGPGRGDGTNHVYVAVNQDKLTEFTFLGTWVETSELHSNVNIQSIAVGKAQNDGKNRVYSTANNRIYEYGVE